MTCQSTRVQYPAIVCAVLLLASTAFPQGSLTPPGPPAPTMKTLAQVEPRFPIATAPFTISTPGSYYLTTNLTVSSGDAITIAANGVTLDLGGFTISSTNPSGTGNGICLNTAAQGTSGQNVTIINGSIIGSVTNNNSGVFSGRGFACGITYSGPGSPYNVRVSGVTVAGCSNHGIQVYNGTGIGTASIVSECAILTVGGNGINAETVANCSVANCGAVGVTGATVLNCSASIAYGSAGYGVYASIAKNCYGAATLGTGVSAVSAENCWGTTETSNYGVAGTVLLNCGGSSASGCGVYAGSVAENCWGMSVSGAGLYAVNSAQNCSGLSTSGTGLSAGNAVNCQGTSTSGTGLFAQQCALNCTGTSTNGTGLYAGNAENCQGVSSTTNGLYAVNSALNCYGAGGCNIGPSTAGLSAMSAENSIGTSSNGVGLSAQSVLNCQGSSFLAMGLYAGAVVQNSIGNSTSYFGLWCSGSAANCIGQGGSSPSSIGLVSTLAENCEGKSLGIGLSAYQAENCFGHGFVTDFAVTNANFCFGLLSTSKVSVTCNKYNMP